MLTPIPPRAPDAQAAFLRLLPQVRLRAAHAFGRLRCEHRRADAVAEAVALAWLWCTRLLRRGKDPARFAGRLARFACLHARAGRQLCGQASSTDALSPVARARRGFAVAALPAHGSLRGNEFDEALRDNSRSPVPDQAAFRLDFPRWLARLRGRDHTIVHALLRGERARDVAGRHRISPARLSQLRRRLRDDWRAFHGESAGSPPRTS